MVDDLKNPSYGYSMLSQIILHMEKGSTLILRKMNNLYSSLYDLLNQNFSTSGEKRYCRIALGALHNPKCPMHNDFRCIVFLTEDEVMEADPPFLNRHEKYRVRVEDLLEYNEKILCSKLVDWVNVFKSQVDSAKPGLMFMNYNSETPFSLVIRTKNEQVAQNEYKDDAKIIQNCKKQLIKTASFDFAIFASLIRDADYRKELLKMYYEIKSQGFGDFCERVISQKGENNKFIVYTYTQISEDIRYKGEVREIKLGSLTSEAEINEEIKICKNSNSVNLLVVRVNLIAESSHLLFIKNILANSLSQTKKGLHAMIIIHLQRFNVGSKKVQMGTIFHGWESVMFDSLNDNYLVPIELMYQPQFTKISSLKLLPTIDDLLEVLFDKCLSKMRYNIESEDQIQRLNVRRYNILKHLNEEDSGEFFGLIKTKISKALQEVKLDSRFEDWRTYINDNGWGIRAKAISPLDAIRLGITDFYEVFVMNVLYALEKDYLLDSYFEAKKEKNNDLLALWRGYFNKLEININWGLSLSVEAINFVFDLVFPFSSHEHKIIEKIQKEVEEEIQEGCKASFDKLEALSLFGTDFFQKITRDQKLFDLYFKDQLSLYMKANKLNLKVEIASAILDRMFIDNKDSKFKEFLSNPRELMLPLRIVEAVLTLEQGEQVIKRCLDPVYNREQPFENFLYESLIQKFSSCEYLSQYQCISNIKSGLKLLGERIFRTKFPSVNLATFRPWPWIDLIQFFESCDKDPSLRFNEIVLLLQTLELDEKKWFCTYDSVEGVINYIKEKTDMKDGVDQKEFKNKLKKLQSQLYKNLISSDDKFTSIHQILRSIDEDADLWKSSAEVIGLVNILTQFSHYIDIKDGKINDLIEGSHDENMRDSKKLIKLQELNELLPTVSLKIHNILINRAFITCKDCLKGTWFKKKVEFNQNVTYFENAIRNGAPLGSLLGVIVWLKSFLYHYSKAMHTELDKTHKKKYGAVFQEVNKIFQKDWPCLPTLKIYVLQIIMQEFSKSLAVLQEEYRTRSRGWILSLLEDDSIQNSQLDTILSPYYEHKTQLDVAPNNQQDLVEERKSNETTENIVEKKQLNNKKYPYLEYFNCLAFPTFKDFKLSFLMKDDKSYPLLKFVMKKHQQLSYVSALPIIVSFTNNLIREFNYRISREKAANTPIKYYFQEKPQLKKEFLKFKKEWNRIELKIVKVGSRSANFKTIDENENLSFFLPNLQKEGTGILLLGTMVALADTQNKFICLAKTIDNPNKSIKKIIEDETPSFEMIQKVKSDDVIDISKERLLEEIKDNGYVNNYECGKGKNIVYDFEEIENRLYQQTYQKRLLNNEKFIQMNYQFELYPQSSSIITDLKTRNPQSPFDQDERKTFRELLKKLSSNSKKDLINYLGSLDYIFTYLCNMKKDGETTIEEFGQSIVNYPHINENLRKKPHCEVKLKNILELYELVEEIVFEEAIDKEFVPKFIKEISEEEKKNILEMFRESALDNYEKGPAKTSVAQKAETLAKFFKKIIVRGMITEYNLEDKLGEYFTKDDMWNQDVDMSQIKKIILDDNIRIKHSYIILEYLEKLIQWGNNTDEDDSDSNDDEEDEDEDEDEDDDSGNDDDDDDDDNNGDNDQEEEEGEEKDNLNYRVFN